MTKSHILIGIARLEVIIGENELEKKSQEIITTGAKFTVGTTTIYGDDACEY